MQSLRSDVGVDRTAAKKFFVVVRSDLTPAQHGVQAVHAALAFVAEHGGASEVALCNLAFLSVRDEEGLHKLLRRAAASGTRWTLFREPDLENTVTAVAFEPGKLGQKLCQGLQKALR